MLKEAVSDMQNKNLLHYVSLALIAVALSFFYYFCLSTAVSYNNICDQIHHLNNQIIFFHDLLDLVREGKSIPDLSARFCGLLQSTGSSWPPLVYLLTSVAQLSFGQTTFVTEMSNMIYVIILLFSIFLIGKKCFNSAAGGLIAALILFSSKIGLYPLFYGLDLPLAAFTTLSFYFLLISEHFKDLKNSLFFGLTLGLGILVKGQILIFLIGPLLYSVWQVLLSRDKVRWVNLATSLFLGAGASSIWWLYQLPDLLQRFWWHVHAYNKNSHVAGNVFSLKSLLYYPRFSVEFFLPPGVALFGVSLFIYIKAKRERNMLLILWFACSFVILTFIRTKWERYFLPVMPAMALIMTYGVLKIGSRSVRRVVVGIILAVAFYNYANYAESYGDEDWKSNFREVAGEISKIMASKENFGSSPQILITERPTSNETASVFKYIFRANFPKISARLSIDEDAPSFCQAADFLITVCNLDGNFFLNRTTTVDPKVLMTGKIRTGNSDSIFLPACLAPSCDGGTKSESEDIYFESEQEKIEALAESGWIFLKEFILFPDGNHVLLFKRRKVSSWIPELF